MELIPKTFNGKFDFSTIKSNKIFVLGIGGGSDVVGAYSIARLIQQLNSQTQLSYGLCVSQKNDYTGFKLLNDNLFQRSTEHIENPDELHTSLALVLKMRKFDKGLEPPYLLSRPAKYDKLKNELSIADYNLLVKRAFENAINYIKPELILAVDMGGDSLTCGMEDEYSFDRTGLRALKQIGKPFIYAVLGPGCDGESTIGMLQTAIKTEISNNSFTGEFALNDLVESMYPVSSELLHNDRTPNIIANAKIKMDEKPDIKNGLIEIQRHREPHIPINWLVKGLAFDGLKLSIE